MLRTEVSPMSTGPEFTSLLSGQIGIELQSSFEVDPAVGQLISTKPRVSNQRPYILTILKGFLDLAQSTHYSNVGIFGATPSCALTTLAGVYPPTAALSQKLLMLSAPYHRAQCLPQYAIRPALHRE